MMLLLKQYYARELDSAAPSDIITIEDDDTEHDVPLAPVIDEPSDLVPSVEPTNLVPTAEPTNLVLEPLEPIAKPTDLLPSVEPTNLVPTANPTELLPSVDPGIVPALDELQPDPNEEMPAAVAPPVAKRPRLEAAVYRPPATDQPVTPVMQGQLVKNKSGSYIRHLI